MHNLKDLVTVIGLGADQEDFGTDPLSKAAQKSKESRENKDDRKRLVILLLKKRRGDK